jgi:hypothetical protein
LDELPARLIGDKAYDSDPLDAQLEQDYGIELIGGWPRCQTPLCAGTPRLDSETWDRSNP